MREAGVYQKLGELNYFTPHPLPPANPPLHMDDEMFSLYGDVNYALGELNEIGRRMRDSKRFINSYVMKEALMSSDIEGIHTTLIELFTQPLSSTKASKETQLVRNYTLAVNAALDMLNNQGLPLVNRVILKAHEVLMSAGDGDRATPGRFRQQSVRVGELVPPPAPEVASLMSGLEKYINESSGLPALIRAGLAHVHFETIHPFLDGNGRIGRLLIVLMLINSGILQSPILYLSYYFKKHQLEYYQRLDRVRTHGDFEGWIKYYLRAILDSAVDATARASDIEDLEERLRRLIQTDASFAKMRETAATVLDWLFTQPITGVAELSKATGKAYNTIQNILQGFARHGLVSEHITHKRNKVYHFTPYLTLLEKEY